jgi:membrane-anchored protein YejM (alkaline phosphatase superfamily)
MVHIPVTSSTTICTRTDRCRWRSRLCSGRVHTVHHTPYTIHHTSYTIHHTSYTSYSHTHHTPYLILTIPTVAITHLLLCSYITEMDAVVGSIMDRLRTNNQYNNTIVVFSSDNGAPNGGANMTHPYGTLQYTTVHYSTLQYTTVHDPSLRYTTLHYTLHYCTILNCSQHSTDDCVY